MPLVAVCRTLIGQSGPGVLGEQVARVVARIASPSVSTTLAPKDIVTVFRAGGRIPPLLIDCCTASSAGQPGEVIAVCFAASAFPRRVFQMETTELTLRVGAFLQLYPALMQASGWSGVAQALQTRKVPPDGVPVLSAMVPPADTADLFRDLAAAESPEARAEAGGSEARRTGAALYLATCYPALARRIVDRWLSEGDAVRLLVEENLRHPPSKFERRPRGEEPNWERVTERLRSAFPGRQPAVERVVEAERALWRYLGPRAAQEVAWNPQEGIGRREQSAALIDQRVESFWEEHWGFLASGFPYYSFQASFKTWWIQCFKNYLVLLARGEGREAGDGDIERLPNRTEGDDDAEEGVWARSRVNARDLRLFREGHRLVRATFFRLRHGASSPEQVADENEELREMLDDLTQERLLGLAGIDLPGDLAQRLQGHAARVDAGTRATYTRRLRCGWSAYVLSRLEGWSNRQIRWARPRFRADVPEGKFPLLNEPRVLLVASIARISALEHTLLWPFAAHVLLRPLVAPRFPDPWTFRRFSRELRHWVCEPGFDRAATMEARDGGRAAGTVEAAWRTEPLRDLVVALCAQGGADLIDLDDQVVVPAELKARRLLASLDGGHPPSQVLEIKRLCGSGLDHWVVPVWYLGCIERLAGQKIVDRLKIEEPDLQATLTRQPLPCQAPVTKR